MMKTKLLGLIATFAFFGVVPPAYRVTVYGFLYSGGTYTALSVPGSNFTQAFGINNKGQIVGDVGGVTPLPAALPLFATGLSVLGLFGWFRKRKDVAMLSPQAAAVSE
jgi:hypothetical protein